jgi:hypothetical protein
MVLKPNRSTDCCCRVFENDVKMYGTQTSEERYPFLHEFENDVKMYGTQTVNVFLISSSMFENDVKMYGT